MRAGIVVKVTPEDRCRLEAIIGDRNAPQKHVWRAKIILATADGCGTAEIMRRSGKAKPVVWRWQARFMVEGVDGLLRDKTRNPGKPPLASGHTDMRKGFDGLALLVQETLKRNPHSGHLFVFRGRRGGLIKVLWHDGQGMCLFAKRLEHGRFVWPLSGHGVVTITPAQLGYLLEGIDWRLPQHTWRPQAAG
jgi:transposase